VFAGLGQSMSQVRRTGDGGEAHEGPGNEARSHHQAKVEPWQQQSVGHANLALYLDRFGTRRKVTDLSRKAA